MLRKHTTISLFLLLIFGAAIITGCSKSAQDTKTPPQDTVGIIDMDKAIKAHPKYSDYQRLQKELNTLMAQAGAQSQPASVNQATNGMPTLPEGAAAGINEALSQEFNAKMDAKKAEIKERLDAQAKKVQAELSAGLDAYTQEVDKEYQPRIFSLQLKLKTLQLSKEEMAALQKELEQVQNERSAKIAAKQKQLSSSLNGRMAPLQAAAEQELNSYGQQLHQELAARGAAKTAEMTARMEQPAVQPPVGGASSEFNGQITLKKQEISALQEFILGDIRDKAAKVAAERKIQAVLTAYKVNVKAIDITDAVITEFKK